MKKITILFLTIFLCSCTKKQLITSGIATGTGLGSYTIFKSFMGQSGTGVICKQWLQLQPLEQLWEHYWVVK